MTSALPKRPKMESKKKYKEDLRTPPPNHSPDEEQDGGEDGQCGGGEFCGEGRARKDEAH